MGPHRPAGSAAIKASRSFAGSSRNNAEVNDLVAQLLQHCGALPGGWYRKSGCRRAVDLAAAAHRRLRRPRRNSAHHLDSAMPSEASTGSSATVRGVPAGRLTAPWAISSSAAANMLPGFTGAIKRTPASVCLGSFLHHHRIAAFRAPARRS